MQKKNTPRQYQLQNLRHGEAGRESTSTSSLRPKVNSASSHFDSKKGKRVSFGPAFPQNKMAKDSDRLPLLAGQRTAVINGQRDVAEHRLSTISDQLGIDEIDAGQSMEAGIHGNQRTSKVKGKVDNPTIVLTQEQVENLIETLESTGEALKQLSLTHHESKPPKRPRIPRWITSHLFAITVFWQFACIMALTVLEAFTKNKKKEKLTFILTIAILVLFQAVNLLLIFITSVKLTKQFMHHTVTRSFLGQSYLSMTVLFAGLYTLVYRIEPSSFKDLGGLGLPDDALASVVLYINMLFYSISIGTLCGAGHVIAAAWYAQMITASQMLMSYVYFASVLSLTIQSHQRISYKIKTKSANVNYNDKSYGAIKTV